MSVSCAGNNQQSIHGSSAFLLLHLPMTLKDFSASEDEMNLANKFFSLSNSQEGGVLKSDAAIDIFQRSGLSYSILRDIWNMVDENATGNLLIHELAAAIRLMGWVQAGEVLEDSLLIKCTLATSVPFQTTHPSLYQPVLFLSLMESQMWLESVMLAPQFDSHQSIMMIYAIINGVSIRRVLVVVFWMVRGSHSFLDVTPTV